METTSWECPLLHPTCPWVNITCFTPVQERVAAVGGLPLRLPQTSTFLAPLALVTLGCCFERWGRRATSLPLTNAANRCLQDPGVLHQLLFFIPYRVVGMEGIHPWLPLRYPLGSRCLVSLQKFWSQSLGGLSTKWGPGTQSISCKNLTH